MPDHDFLQIAQQDIELLYSSRNIILCNSDLADLFKKAVRPESQIMPYASSGKIGTTDGETISLSQLGLPTGIKLVIGYSGCQLFHQLNRFAQDIGYPEKISFLSVPKSLPKILQSRIIIREYLKFSEQYKNNSIAKLSEAEQQVSRLRQEVEALKASNRGATMMLEKVGIGCQELLLEDMPLKPMPLDAKLVQPLPSLLCDIGGISICSAPSKSQSRVKLSVTAAGKTLVERTINLQTSGGWAEIFFPQELLMENYGGELVVEPIDLDAQILMAKGLADHRTSLMGHEGQRLALRIWRPHFGQMVQPGTQRAIRLIDLPDLNNKNFEPLFAGEVKELSQNRITLESDAAGKAQYFLTDIALKNVQSITATCTWLNSKNGKARVIAWVLDSTGKELAKTVQDQLQDAIGNATLELSPDTPTDLTVLIDDAHRSGRGSLFIEYQGENTENAKAENTVFSTSNIELNLKPEVNRVFYKCASFVELTRHTQYADGPLAEMADNDAAGFPLVSTYEVGGFLQTHARQNDITAVRIDNLVPAGASRIWIDVSSGHEKANDAEFCVYLTPEIPSPGFRQLYQEMQFDDLAADTTHMFDDGAIFKKQILSGGKATCINFNLADGVDRPLTAYLYVRPVDGDPNLGWLRWHRIGITGHAAL